MHIYYTVYNIYILYMRDVYIYYQLISYLIKLSPLYYSVLIHNITYKYILNKIIIIIMMIINYKKQFIKLYIYIYIYIYKQYIQSMQDNNIDCLLSEQQRIVIQNILSIQDYYHLKDHRKLISIILNKKQSQELFGQKKVMISNVFEKNKDILDQQAKVNIFADKYTYEVLAQKFKRPKSFKNNTLTAVLRKKMEKQVIGSHTTRKSIWMLASGALFSMKNNKGLYQALINYPDYPKYYERSIMLDLHRTIKKTQSNQQQIKALKNLLIAFSRRNPYIGYCQGLNFIAFFLLTMQFSQEQSFWLLSQITQTIIPMDYYTNMVGVACDQQIFLEILKILKPQIIKKFNDVGLDGSVLSIQWFVCLFTSSLPFYLVKIVWDRLLVQGIQAFIKAGIIILSHFQKEILETKQFYQIIMLIEQGSKNLQITQAQFNKQFDKLYINQQGLKIARDLYREFHIKQKLNQKISHNNTSTRPKKTQDNQCNLSWPLCVQALNQSRRNMFELQIWTYRQESSPKIIHDYMENIKKKQSHLKSTIGGSEQKITTLLKSTSLKSADISDYVIGRMEHICKSTKSEKKLQQRKFKKEKNNGQYLSMIMEEEQDDDKKISNLQKILRLSAINIGENQDQTVQENQLDKKGFQKSQTIEFYSQFVNNNKQLAEMMAGKK